MTSLLWKFGQDGSIKPDEAVDMASTILIDYLKLFQTSDGKGSYHQLYVSEPEAPEPSKRVKLIMSIDDLDLSVRSNNCLRRRYQYCRRIDPENRS